jgi:hypothetical protein
MSRGTTLLCANLWPGWIAIQYKYSTICTNHLSTGTLWQLIGLLFGLQADWQGYLTLWCMCGTPGRTACHCMYHKMLIILESSSTFIYSPFKTPLEHGGYNCWITNFLTGWHALWKDHIIPQFCCYMIKLP